MTVLLRYDGTFDGFLSCIFEVYDRKLANFSIVRMQHYHPSLLCEAIDIGTDPTKAARVWSGLHKHLSRTKCHEIYKSFLSELPQIEQVLSDFIRHAFASKGKIENDIGHPAVLAVSQIAHKVHREKHRMEAFVRFQRTKDGLYFASIIPDFNVLPLIVSHFRDRYADQDWLIFDRKRKYGAQYDCKSRKVSEVLIDLADEAQGEFLPAHLVHDEEIEYQKLWKGYFHSVNIGSRKNQKLHVRHVPTRYWRYLTEKREW